MNRFIIARPPEKATQTVDCFFKRGLKAIPWSVIDIQLMSFATVIESQQNKFNFNTIIVTSTYAVDWLSKENGISAFDLSSTKNIICVGNSTAEKLNVLLSENTLMHSSINLVIAEPSNSEGILLCECLQCIKHEHIAIIKGRGGRDLLEKELTQRDAEVTVLDVYRRIVNTQNLNDEKIIIEQTDCLVATSIEIVEAIFNHYDKARLRAIHWIVPSTRIKKRLEGLSVANVLLSDNASANSLVHAALQLVKTGVVDD